MLNNEITLALLVPIGEHKPKNSSGYSKETNIEKNPVERLRRSMRLPFCNDTLEGTDARINELRLQGWDENGRWAKWDHSALTGLQAL